MQSDLGCSYCDVQREPENSVIGRRLLDSSYDFKQSNVHYIQHLCSVHRPFYFITDV